MATRCKPKTTHLENFSSIPKRVGGVVVVVEAENDNMHSDWIDQVSISKNQRGNFAVFGKKHVGSNKPPFRRRWVTWDKVIGIKSPLGLITGLKQVAESLGVEIGWQEVIEKVATLDWVTAAVMAVQEDQPVPCLPPIASVLGQRSLRSFKKVCIGVEWGYDMHEVDLSFETWIRILGGEQHSVRPTIRQELEGSSSPPFRQIPSTTPPRSMPPS